METIKRHSAFSIQSPKNVEEIAKYRVLWVKNFKDLKVWHKAHQLTLDAYKVTRNFPKDELYGLTGQMRRSAASVPANIAEGCGRASDAELGRFLQIAMGSASEFQYHILLAHDLNLLNTDQYQKLEQNVIEVKRMLTSFIKKLKADS